MDRSDVFIGVRQRVLPTRTTGSIICMERRPPAPTGTMKVREGRNARGGAGAGRSRFPGEECQHKQQSLPAAIHPGSLSPASGSISDT